MEWQPIETAPKDGTPILVATYHTNSVGRPLTGGAIFVCEGRDILRSGFTYMGWKPIIEAVAQPVGGVTMKHECGNCAYYLDNNRGHPSGYGKCRRYPQAVETNDERWCGEHKPKPEADA